MAQNPDLLFSVTAVHSPESCPLNNEDSRQIFLQIGSKARQNLKKFNIKRMVDFYMSVLEHQWTLIFEAKNAHDIEKFCIEIGISKYHTLKIVPLSKYVDVVKKINDGKRANTDS